MVGWFFNLEPIYNSCSKVLYHLSLFPRHSAPGYGSHFPAFSLTNHFFIVCWTLSAALLKSEICYLPLKGIEFYSGRHLICWQISFLLVRLVARTCKGGSEATLIKRLEP